jgi:predicted RNA-binding protein with PIN domain
MLYLIDGYNLLFAMGVLLPGRTGPHVLGKARLRLLGLLHGGYADRSADVTVVFDAKHAPPGVPAARDYQGIHVTFAVHEAEADDLIEELIRRASAPQHLTVVSNDHRIQQAARRRHCVVQGCGDFLDWLEEAHRPRRPPPPEDAKPDRVSPEDTRRWLREFADLADDPALAELFDPPWSEGETG